MKNKYGYDAECIKEDVCDMAVCDGKSCNHYVSKAVVENCHSLQQLKDAIVRSCPECQLQEPTMCDCFDCFAEKLRRTKATV